MEKPPQLHSVDRKDPPTFAGVRNVPIHTEFLDPAYVPDYRTEADMQALQEEIPILLDEEYTEEDLFEPWDENLEGESNPEAAIELSEPNIENDVPQPLVPDVQTAKAAKEKASASVDAAEVVDQDAVDGILARLKATTIANHNHAPTTPIKKLEVVGGTEHVAETLETTQTKNIETTADAEPLRRFVNVEIVQAQKTAVDSSHETQDNSEYLNISNIEDEITNLDTDLNALTRETNAWKADLQTRKKYRRVKTELQSLMQKHTAGTDMVSGAIIAEKMQRLRDLHQAIFEFEMRQNELLDEDGEAIPPAEEVSTAFEKTDEPELPFTDLPRVSKVGMSRERSMHARTETLEDAAEVASAAENLMLKELRNKGIQQEWEQGSFFGIGRAVSQMRVDDFLRTKDAHDKYRVWFSDLQERAGAFAPHLELGTTLGEYVPKLYQGIIQAQLHAKQNGTESARARLLGI